MGSTINVSLVQNFGERAAGMADKFEIIKDKSGEYRFHLKAGNGEIIAASQGYKTKASALNGVESVQKNAADAGVVDMTVGTEGFWRAVFAAVRGTTRAARTAPVKPSATTGRPYAATTTLRTRRADLSQAQALLRCGSVEFGGHPRRGYPYPVPVPHDGALFGTDPPPDGVHADAKPLRGLPEGQPASGVVGLGVHW